jgi:TonB family protein
MAKSILVVDYDPKRIEATTRPFTQAGYAVEIARDGVQGVEAFARLHPDLVLIEMMLPKRHGFEVCQELRKLRPGHRTPVLILGGTQAERYRLQAIGAGANDYLVRPIEGHRLLEICTSLMAEPNQDLPEAPAEDASGIPLEDSIPDFFDAPAPAADAPVHPESEKFLEGFLAEADEPDPMDDEPPPANLKFDLGDLSDDDITARLDAILPSDPALSSPRTAPEVSKPPRPVEPKPPEQPKAALPPPERTAPRTRLPQTEPVFESAALESTSRRRLPSWPVAAVIVLVTLAGAFYGWRAMTHDETALNEVSALDAADFARVRPVPPVPAEPAPSEEPREIAEAPETVPPEAAAPVRLAEPAARPAEKAPAPAPPTPAPPAPKEPVAAAPVPSAPAKAEPEPAAPSPVVAENPAPSAPPPAGDRPRAEAQAQAPEIAAIEALGVKPVAVEVLPPPPQPRKSVVAGSIVDLDEVDSLPVATSRTAPTYPRLALRLRREGRVTLRLLVDENGVVADATPLESSSGVDFESAAVDAARQWRYRPARKDGVPVKVWITEVVEFRL